MQEEWRDAKRSPIPTDRKTERDPLTLANTQASNMRPHRPHPRTSNTAPANRPERSISTAHLCGLGWPNALKPSRSSVGALRLGSGLRRGDHTYVHGVNAVMFMRLVASCHS